MPSVSKPQAHLMAAVAHGWQPPGHHIDVNVAKEFHAADKDVGKYEHPTARLESSPIKQNQSSDHQNGY
jgi:hypothetical protein